MNFGTSVLCQNDHTCILLPLPCAFKVGTAILFGFYFNMFSFIMYTRMFLSVLQVDDSILDALDSPTQTPPWPIGVTSTFFELVYMVWRTWCHLLHLALLGTKCV